jgi:hypothetical protein
VASPQFEGLRTPPAHIAVAEVGETSKVTANRVAGNLTAARDALNGARRDLTVEGIQQWRRLLMGPTGRLPEEMVGAVRTPQSWIGGTSPRTASFVPSPPDRVEDLMVDLVGFVYSD